MNGATAIVLALVGSGITGAGSAWITGRYSTKTEEVKAVLSEGALELDGRRADGEAYERAEKSYLHLITTLTQEISRLERIIEGLRSDLAESLQHRAELENRVRELEDSAAAMRQLLRDAGVAYPQAKQEVGG